MTMFQQSIYQLANRIHICQLRIRCLGPKRALQRNHKFDSFHGVETQVELQVIVRMNFALFLTSGANHTHRLLYLIVGQPQPICCAEFAFGGDVLHLAPSVLLLQGPAPDLKSFELARGRTR